MTDIAAANVSYSFKSKDKMFLGRRGFSARGTISFGDGSLTYGSAKVPVTKAKIGLPRVLRSIQIIEQNAVGYTIEFDVSAQTLRLFHSAAVAVAGNVAAPKINFGSAAGNVAADLVVGVAALTANTSLVANTTITGVTGVQAPAFTGDTVAASRLSELSGQAIQAVVLEVECEGY